VHRWLAGLLFLLAGVTAAQAHELLDRLDACIGRLDQDLDVGYERVAARCPELTAALAHSAWAPWLPADWNQRGNQLSAQGLTELRTLLSRSLTLGTPVRAPRPEYAAAVVARISQADAARHGWWERLKAWLRGVTAGDEGDSAQLGAWFGAQDFPHGVAQAVAWLALALVVAIALAIFVNELRIAGVLKVRSAASRGDPRVAGREADHTLIEVERHDLREQPALLLELIADSLTAQGRLPPARALTAGELLRGAHLADESGRAWLAELTATCEQLRFSIRDVGGAGIASAIAAGRRVLVGLEDGACAHPAATPGA
jgi:hypothetical protein